MRWKPRIIAAVLLLAATTSAHATSDPFQRGSRLLGGSASFTYLGGLLHEQDTGEARQEYQLHLGGQQFLRDHWAVGVIFEHREERQGEAVDKIWGLGPQLTVFLEGQESQGSARGRFLPYLGSHFAIGTFDRLSGVLNAERVEYTLLTLRIKGGMMLMLAEAVGLSFEVFHSFDWGMMREPRQDEWERGGRTGLSIGYNGFLF